MGFNLNNFGTGVGAASGLFGMFDNIFGFGRKRNMRDNQEMMRYSAGLGESQAKRDYARTLDMFGKQSDFSRDMFGQEMDFNREMLANQQQYNSAEAQKQRLKDAGLSVGLMMGGGGAGASTSASTSAPSAPSGSPAPSGRPTPMSLSDKLYGALTLDSMKTAIEGAKLDNDSKKVKIAQDLADASIDKTKVDTQIAGETLKQSKVDTEIAIDYGKYMAEQDIVNKEANNLLTNRQAGILRKELEWFNSEKSTEIAKKRAETWNSLENAEQQELTNKWRKAVDHYGLNPVMIELLPYISKPVVDILTKGMSNQSGAPNKYKPQFPNGGYKKP